MEMFCKDLRNQAMKIIYYEKKEMIPLTDEETKFYEKQEVCYIREKEFSTDKNDKTYHKVRIIVIAQENLEELLIIIATYDIKYQKKFL